jgi:hypothetical protein
MEARKCDYCTHQLIEILEEIKKLQAMVSGTTSNLTREKRSEKIDELCAALSKAQGEFKIATKNQINVKLNFNSEKYADLTAIVNASRPALAANGLAVLQAINEHSSGANYLHTTLTHSSGQWVESVIKLVPSEDDIDSVESNIICMRRHAYASLVGVIIENEDDDGAADSRKARQEKAEGKKLNRKINLKRDQSYETINQEQYEEILYELGDHEDIAEQILKGMNITSLANIPKDKFPKSISRIRELIQLREGK